MLRTKRRLHHARRHTPKKALSFGTIVIIVLLLTGIYSFFQVRAIRKSGNEVYASAKKVKESLKNNNIDEVKTNLAEVRTKYDSFKKSASGMYLFRFVPLLGSYVSDFKNGVEAGDSMVSAGLISVDAIAPYADLIGFKKGATFAEKSADDRIQTAVLTLDKVLVKMDDIAVHVDKARHNIEAINTDHYPEKIGSKIVRERIKSVIGQFDSVATLFVDAKPFIKSLPDMLGTDREKTYVVLFQNDKELRPTGGFLTAYAIFKIKQGKINVVKSSDIYDLDASISSHPAAPDKILTYHKGVSSFFIRDSNLSPDFAESIKLFDSLYQKSNQKVAYDGIFAMDTNVLVNTLSVLGDTEVRGTVFSSRNEPKCDCPQVIYRLLDEIDRPVNYIKTDRKGILGDLLYAIMQKALGFSPSQYWGKLSQELIKDLQEKHILVYLKDPNEQKAVEQINFGGRIKKVDTDYLHINDANMAGAKSNLFVNHTIKSETNIKGDGTVERTLTIDYKNPYRPSDCNLERGGLCLNATLRNWIRVYVPENSSLTSFQGSERKVLTYPDLGYTVYEGFLQVKPQGKSSVVVKYVLPFKVKNEKEYQLLMQKQPGTKGHDVTIFVNDKLKESFKLVEDKVYKMK